MRRRDARARLHSGPACTPLASAVLALVLTALPAPLLAAQTVSAAAVIDLWLATALALILLYVRRRRRRHS